MVLVNIVTYKICLFHFLFYFLFFCHLIVVGGFEWLNDASSYVAWGFMPLLGSHGKQILGAGPD